MVQGYMAVSYTHLKGEEISNIAILEYLENIAAYHSDSVGYGVNTTKQTNLN